LPLKSLRGDEENLLFQILVHAAEKRLVLMTSRLDESSDRERMPSQFFLRCAEAARGTSLTLREMTPEYVPGLRSVSLDDPGPGKGRTPIDRGEIRLGIIAADPASGKAVLAEIARMAPELLAGPMAYEKARWERELTVFDGRIADPELCRLIGDKLRANTSQISASQIEEYAKCPYFFFLRRIHGLKKWEEDESIEAMDPLDRGKAVHEIIEAFVTHLGHAGFSAGHPEELPRQLLEHAIRELDAKRPAALPDLLWEIEKDRLLAMLDHWLAFEIDRVGDRLLPAFMERAFGSFAGATGSPPYVVQLPAQPLEFRGRIDRIDVSPDGTRARVVDYKTGSLPKTMEKKNRPLLMGGEKIQLAVYSGALFAMPDLNRVESLEAEYLHLQPTDGKIKPCPYSDADLRAALARLPEMLRIIWEGMQTGIFFARSKGLVRGGDHCSFCDFLPICGKDRAAREARKSGDRDVCRFSLLVEIDEAAGLELEEDE
jgi:RecB family exonuclease